MGKNRKSSKKRQANKKKNKAQGSPNRSSKMKKQVPDEPTGAEMQAALDALGIDEVWDVEEDELATPAEDRMEITRVALNEAIDREEAEPGKHHDALLGAYQEYVIAFAEEEFLGKALRAHNEALGLLRELYQKTPEVYGPKLVEGLLLARELWFDPLDNQYAPEFLEEAETVINTLITSGPRDRLPQLKDYQDDVASGYRDMYMPVEMVAFQRRSLECLKRITESLPEYRYLVCAQLLDMADNFELLSEEALDEFSLFEEEEAEEFAVLKELDAAELLKEANSMNLDPAVVGTGHCDALLGQASVLLGAMYLEADDEAGATMMEQGMARLNGIPADEPLRLPALRVGLKTAAFIQTQRKDDDAAACTFGQLITLLLDKIEHESGPSRKHWEQELHDEFDQFTAYLKKAKKDPQNNAIYQRAISQVGEHLTEIPAFDDLDLDDEDFEDDDLW